MAQSVELLLDHDAEAAVRRQWSALAEAGLPTEHRVSANEHHRPHVTLFAADRIGPTAEAALPEMVSGLDLEVVLGSALIFGPRGSARPRGGRCILVRHVVASEPLLALQRRVAEVCGADRYGQFGPGRWAAHVTLARRVLPDQLGRVISLLGDDMVTAHITQCRRWDGTAKTAWLL